MTQWHQSKNQCVEKYCSCYKRSYVNDVYMEGEWVKYLENYHVLFGFVYKFIFVNRVVGWARKVDHFLWTSEIYDPESMQVSGL